MLKHCHQIKNKFRPITYCISLLSIFSFLATHNSMCQSLDEKWVSCINSGCKIVDDFELKNPSPHWEGSCIDGKAQGNGTLTVAIEGKTIFTYNGQYQMGRRSGFGKLIDHRSGDIWEGQFENGILNGIGTLLSGNGNKYKGKFIRFSMHGEGVLHFGNGKKFEGIFRNGLPYSGEITNIDESVIIIHKGDTVVKSIVSPVEYNPKIGQETSEFFDENWGRCEAKKAKYYRRIKYKEANIPEGKIRDFYISGALYAEYECLFVDYKDELMNFKVGEEKWYYESGALKGICNHGTKNQINGKLVTFYENGAKEYEAQMEKGLKNGIEKTWYANGKINTMAFYKAGTLYNNKFVEYDENGLGSLVQLERFKSQYKKWTVDSKGNTADLNEQGEICIEVKNDKEFYLGVNHFDVDRTGDYSIESTFIKSEGKGNEWYGLIFGHKDPDNFYAFQISELGYYCIYGEVEGVKINIRDYFISSAINRGNNWNQLKVIKFGDYMNFYINGEVVEKLKASYFKGNNFGFFASGKGKYTLSSLIVKEFVSPEELEDAVPEVSSDGDWKGSGSGFFISKNGHIATNYHVIENSEEIQVEFLQNDEIRTYSAKILITDKQNDLAIIKILDSSFQLETQIQYGYRSDMVDVGTEVFTLGYPLTSVMGDEIKFADGKISSKSGIQGDITKYQISVPVQPGNSGGPLFDLDGNLIGVVVSKLLNAENVSYAIKVSYLKSLVDTLPEKITFSSSDLLKSKNLTEQIKLLSGLVPKIKIR